MRRSTKVTVYAALVIAVSSMQLTCQRPDTPSEGPVTVNPVLSPDSSYLTPPSEVVAILEAEKAPQAVVSPSREVIALLDRDGMPPVEVLAQPLLRLAGYRLNPQTNGSYYSYSAPDILELTLVSVADGASTKVSVPTNTRMGSARFSPDGRQIAFATIADSGLELWVADVATGQAKALTEPILNGTWGDPCEWLDDASGLVCRFVSQERGPAPERPKVAPGPNVRENLGEAAPARTYQDLLEDAYDEALFEYYFASQLSYVDAQTGRQQPMGTPGLVEEFSTSPDGEYILVARLKRPFSRLVPASDFTKDVEVWNREGELIRTIADLPLAETIPIEGVRTGPRSYSWDPTRNAALVWVEALDGGDPRQSVPHRDRIMSLTAPFEGEPIEQARTEYRFRNVLWTEEGAALVSTYDRAKRRTRMWLVQEGSDPRVLFDRSAEDRYGDPGRPITKPSGIPQRGWGANSDKIVIQDGQSIYLAGDGASPEGDRPFVDRLNLATLETERLFRCDEESYETAITLLTDDGVSLLMQRETRTTPPNYLVRDTTQGTTRALTHAENPYPQLAAVEQRLLTYERNDGLKLSAMLYLPPASDERQPLPLIVWAYPREFTDPGAAGQVTGSPNRFTEINFGNMHFLFLAQGYALVVPTMPIVGSGETANDTYVEQLVANAQAAVDTVVSMGAADRERIGIAGHSYGAFMTANLLAHSDIFRAGMAWSGAYNRSLTPFGFQNERRTIWEVPDAYVRMSPFFHADKVNEPILLIHGEIDANSGTFPIQSERFYMALKGNGKRVRYVTLPHEAHRYAARETLFHVAAEGLKWFDEHLNNGKGPPTVTSAGMRSGK